VSDGVSPSPKGGGGGAGSPPSKSATEMVRLVINGSWAGVSLTAHLCASTQAHVPLSDTNSGISQTAPMLRVLQSEVTAGLRRTQVKKHHGTKRP